MIYLTESQTAQLISHNLAYQAVREAFIAAISDKTRLFPVVNATGTEADSIFSLKAACAESIVGWKTGSYWPNNTALGKHCHGTTIFLLEPADGSLSAIVEASQVNAYRTAAADAVAVDCLARQSATTLAIFGTGHQAEYEVMAVSAVREIKTVLVVGRSIARTEAFVGKLIKKGILAQSADAQSACERADIVITATTSTSPLFKAEWIKSGTHISAMGADKKGKNELPTELYRYARLFCDYSTQSVVIGEFQHTRDTPITDIGHVLTGQKSGRTSANEITIFDSSGIAIQDLIVAKKLIELSQENSL